MSLQGVIMTTGKIMVLVVLLMMPAYEVDVLSFLYLLMGANLLKQIA